MNKWSRELGNAVRNPMEQVSPQSELNGQVRGEIRRMYRRDGLTMRKNNS
jgi:hypothetical protein